jgi:hypothetical protein
MIFIVSSQSSLRGSDDSCAADVLQLLNYFPAGRRSQACNRIRGGAEYSPLRHDHIEIAALQSIGILLRWCHCDGRAGA